jgi:hypothetical protein
LAPVEAGDLKRSSPNRCHHLLKTFWPGWRDEQFPHRRVAIDSLKTQRRSGVAQADQMREGGLGDQWQADRGAGDWPGTHAHARRTDDSLSDKRS